MGDAARAFDRLALSVVKRLHAVLRAKEPLVSTPQLWRAVCLEELVFQQVNEAAGHKKAHDFPRRDPALVPKYSALAEDLVAFLDKKRDAKFWKSLAKRQRPSKMKSVFREYLEERDVSVAKA